jgi:chemotaxis protein methyltransferase CheR
MNAGDVEFVGELVRRRSGLAIAADKGYLLESRLGPVARREGYASVPVMIAALRDRRDERLGLRITEAMATCETRFFRDRAPFEHFRDAMLPALEAARPAGTAIRVWCAGCSTGQEPYSLAMIVEDLAPKLAGRPVEILATDLNSSAVEKAKAGVYSQFEVQRGLPVRQLVRHFEQQGELWSVRPELKRALSFAVVNLADDFQALGMFDVVFCRNVLSFFDPARSKDVLERLAAQIAKGGYLTLGATEAAGGLAAEFVPVKSHRGVFERTAGAASKVA